MKLSYKITFIAIFMAMMTSCELLEDAVFTRVSITQITVEALPPVNALNENWDTNLAGTFPDVIFEITIAGTQTALFKPSASSRYSNVRTVDLPICWENSNGSPIFTNLDLGQAIDLDFYDFDDITFNDYMGTATVDFNNYLLTYPSTITVTSDSGDIRVTLELSWGT